MSAALIAAPERRYVDGAYRWHFATAEDAAEMIRRIRRDEPADGPEYVAEQSPAGGHVIAATWDDGSKVYI